MDALALVSANDDILEGRAVLELEDGVGGTTLSLATALLATAVGLHATIKGARDDLGLGVGDGALGGRDIEAEGALNELGSRGGGGSNGESAEESGCDEIEGRHCSWKAEWSSQWITEL